MADRPQISDGTWGHLIYGPNAKAYGEASLSRFAPDPSGAREVVAQVSGEAAELAASGASDEVKRVRAALLPLNARFQETATRWQVRPGPGDPLALNDHTDFRWDERVIDALGAVGHRH